MTLLVTKDTREMYSQSEITNSCIYLVKKEKFCACVTLHDKREKKIFLLDLFVSIFNSFKIHWTYFQSVPYFKIELYILYTYIYISSIKLYEPKFRPCC